MKIALLADAHGNSFALDRVLDVLAHESIDIRACLGDVAVLGPDPAGTCARLRAWADVAVLGNTDEWLTSELTHPEVADLHGHVEAGLAKWSLGRLAPADLDWLASLPLSEVIDLPGSRRLEVFHGTPQSNLAVISALTPDEVLLETMDASATLAAGGHTHVQLLKRVDRFALINPGSVGLPGAGPDTPGLPRNRDVTFVEYAVLDIDEAGASIDLRRMEIPVAEMIAWARQSGMPHPDWWIDRWSLR